MGAGLDTARRSSLLLWMIEAGLLRALRPQVQGLDAAVAMSVEAVITLCAEEVCPTYLWKAHRIHWGLPDRAAVTGTEETRLAALQKVRDQLVRRLSFLFEGMTGK